MHYRCFYTRQCGAGLSTPQGPVITRYATYPANSAYVIDHLKTSIEADYQKIAVLREGKLLTVTDYACAKRLQSLRMRKSIPCGISPLAESMHYLHISHTVRLVDDKSGHLAMLMPIGRGQAMAGLLLCC